MDDNCYMGVGDLKRGVEEEEWVIMVILVHSS